MRTIQRGILLLFDCFPWELRGRRWHPHQITGGLCQGCVNKMQPALCFWVAVNHDSVV
jgi:hypothetical protein